MKSRHALYVGLLIAILIAAGCSSTQPTAKPTDTPAPEAATATKAPDVATAEPDPGAVTMGFTEDGLPYRGDPNAPVTLYEYSDFQ